MGLDFSSICQDETKRSLKIYSEQHNSSVLTSEWDADGDNLISLISVEVATIALWTRGILGELAGF